MNKIIVLIIITGAVIAAFTAHGFIKRKVDPGKSTGAFITYILLHLAAVFIIMFVTGFIIFKYAGLFIKK